MSEVAAVRPNEGFDGERVAQLLRAHGLPVGHGPLEVAQFRSGHSNLTYLLRGADGAWEGVLRRPPLGPVAPKAHDMGREARVLSLLHPVYPLAPQPYFFCADASVIGAPFYVMERRQGVVLDQQWPEGLPFTAETGRFISEAVVDTLVDLHEVGWQDAGLDEIGHPQGYMERQVQGWIERYQRAKTSEIDVVPALCRWFREQRPASPAPTLIHNDFKLNNLMLAPADLSRVTAVLDWEMATVGDPLSDLAGLASYWTEPGDEDLFGGIRSVTTLPGFMSRDELLERYAERSGRDLSPMNFYLAFAAFKIAVIVQQIYYRWQVGQTQDERFRHHGQVAENLIRHAYRLAGAPS